MMDKIIDWLLRRKTLVTILYILTAFMIRELAAIGASDDIKELCEKVREEFPNIFVYIFTKLAEILFAGGSWYIAGTVLLIIIIFAILKWSEDKNIDNKPILECELVRKGRQKHPGRLTNDNMTEENGKLVVHHNKAVRVNKFIWKYELVIRNNSSSTAYNIELFNNFDGEKSSKLFIEDINALEPIESKGSKHIEIQFSAELKSTGSESVEILNGDFADSHFSKKVSFLLKYKNEKRRNFYTLFSTSSKDNLLSQSIPKLWKKILK